MNRSAVLISDVSKSHNGRKVLDAIHLSVEVGESLALMGPNGAGKTTLLRCLLDFQRPDRGTITLFGQPTCLALARRQVAFLPERFHAPTFLSGQEFLRLSAQLYGQPWSDLEAQEGCRALALDWAALRQPVDRLSKGSSQKLGLLACLLSQRQLYILDEPLSGLDVQARALALRQLQRLREEGRTLLFTCHEPADVDLLCHRVALLHHGSLLFCDTPEALRLRHPGNSLETSLLALLAAHPPAQESLT